MGFMEDIDPKILDFWQAFFTVVPNGDEARQLASICAGISNLFDAQAAAAGVDMKRRLATTIDYMPEDYIPQEHETPKAKQEKPKVDNLAQQENLLKKMAGF